MLAVEEEGGDGGEYGEGVLVDGESSDRGIELVTRSDARGLCFVGWGGGEAGLDEGDGEDDGGGGALLSRASLAVSSHAARAEGSTGQAEGGGTFEGCWIWLEEVFPMFYLGEQKVQLHSPQVEINVKLRMGRFAETS